MVNPVQFPRLYVILDSGCFAGVAALCSAAEALACAGCSLFQYRNKSGNTCSMLEEARKLKRLLGECARAPGIRLIMNDRADLALACEFDGLHIGQDDLSPGAARRVIGPDRWLGISTHNPEQIAEADRTDADYLAIGPVFSTRSKANPDPVVGLEGVRRARALTRKPLVAVGGITRQTARSVIDAGADSVAVISDVLDTPRKSAEEFLAVLR